MKPEILDLLVEKQAKLYYADWCGFCHMQLETLKVNKKNPKWRAVLVDCSSGPVDNVSSYPTWRCHGYSNLQGVQTEDKLLNWLSGATLNRNLETFSNMKPMYGFGHRLFPSSNHSFGNPMKEKKKKVHFGNILTYNNSAYGNYDAVSGVTNVLGSNYANYYSSAPSIYTASVNSGGYYPSNQLMLNGNGMNEIHGIKTGFGFFNRTKTKKPKTLSKTKTKTKTKKTIKSKSKTKPKSNRPITKRKITKKSSLLKSTKNTDKSKSLKLLTVNRKAIIARIK